MSKTQTPQYIVSACLAGEKCRYDGNSNDVDAVINMVKDGRAIPVCPEVMGGLTTPRVRCELRRLNNELVEVYGENNINYTEAFKNGAMLALDRALKNGITKAILKSKSPSCGCGIIYNGTFSGELVEGNGIAAELFIKSGIKVITEDEFDKSSNDSKTST